MSETPQPANSREAKIDFFLAVEALLKAADLVKQHRDRLLGKQDTESRRGADA